MRELLQVLAALAGFALYPLLGYIVIRCARRRPRTTMAVLFIVLVAATGAVVFAMRDGFHVAPDTRRATYGSELGRWCFQLGAVAMVLGVPALPLVAVARSPNGAHMGPVGAQWPVTLFGYFMMCSIWGMVLYSWLTGIVK